MTNSVVRGNYDRLSRLYDWFAGPEKQFMKIGLKILNIKAGDKILEIGFGTGHALIEMAHSAGQDGKVYGVDLSSGMVKRAHTNMIRAGLSNRVALKMGNAVNLPYKNNAFDAVFMSFTLEVFNISEISTVLEEVKRVLKHEGLLGVVALENKDTLPVKIYEWFHKHMASMVDCQPVNLLEILEASMFVPVARAEKLMWGLPVSVIVARNHE